MKRTHLLASIASARATFPLAGGLALFTLTAGCGTPAPSTTSSTTKGSGSIPLTGFVAPVAIPKVAAANGDAVTGWIDSHVPPEITWTTSEVNFYLSSYQKVKTTVDKIIKDAAAATDDAAKQAAKDAAQSALKLDYVSLALDVISILGLAGGGSGSNVNKVLQQVIADIQAEYAGLAWQANTIEWATLEGYVTGLLGVAAAYYNQNGNYGQTACPLPDLNGCGTANAVGTIASLETAYNSLFGRPYSASAVAGSWQGFLAATRNGGDGTVAKPMSAAVMPGTSWVFDWRVGITALAQFVAQYTQIWPLTDPNFDEDGVWNTPHGGVQDLRTFLEGIYTQMVQGVHADYMCKYWPPSTGGWNVYCDAKHIPAGLYSSAGTSSTITTEAPVAGSDVWYATVGAADINTGIQAVTSGVTPTTLGPNCATGVKVVQTFVDAGSRSVTTSTTHHILPSQSCLSDLTNNGLALVFSKMPLADMRATIDQLAGMQNTSIETSLLPTGTIADCQSLADQYGIVQNASWGSANTTALQAQWQASGCYARASWLDLAWSLRSNRSFDYDGDGKADLAVWRPDNSGWRPLSGQVTGSPTLKSTAQLGNGLGMFYRINSGDWSAWNSIPYGYNTDVPIPGYYEGPGHPIMQAVWRPSTGAWYLMDSSGTIHTFNWGGQGNVPLPADYDGDGIDDMMIWDPSSGVWALFPSGGQGPYAYYNNPYYSWQWGQQGDIPVPADYDGDQKADLAVWRPIEGNWYILNSTGGTATVGWGEMGDIPVPANYEGLGTDLAIFRPVEGKFYILNHDRTAGWWVGWGQQGDIPVPGDYDGDGKDDFAVFRPSNSTWYWINSSDWSGHYMQYGETGDIPLP